MFNFWSRLTFIILSRALLNLKGTVAPLTLLFKLKFNCCIATLLSKKMHLLAYIHNLDGEGGSPEIPERFVGSRIHLCYGRLRTNIALGGYPPTYSFWANKQINIIYSKYFHNMKVPVSPQHPYRMNGLNIRTHDGMKAKLFKIGMKPFYWQWTDTKFNWIFRTHIQCSSSVFTVFISFTADDEHCICVRNIQLHFVSFYCQ